jgi:hypothetical protein
MPEGMPLDELALRVPPDGRAAPPSVIPSILAYKKYVACSCSE